MRASGAFFRNAIPNAGRPVKYCGFVPGAAGGVSKLTLTVGCSPSAAVPRKSQKLGFKPVTTSVPCRPRKACAALTTLNDAVSGWNTPALNRSTANASACLYASVSHKCVSLPEASTAHRFGPPNIDGYQPLPVFTSYEY